MAVALDAQLWRACKSLSRRSRDLPLKRLVTEALESQLNAWRDAELELEDAQSGTVLHKPAGAEFPPRQGTIKTGYPVQDTPRTQASTARVNVRIPRSTRDRWYDAVYALNGYLSHLTQRALETYLDAFEQA
ncbi:MAG: hypothetical protein AAFX99_07210 [Myxococcota bacterium]